MAKTIKLNISNQHIMSDTDDTDFLLLIPPDFFVVRSPRCISPFYHSTNFETDVKIFPDTYNFQDIILNFKNMENESTSCSNKYQNESYEILNKCNNSNNESLTSGCFNSSFVGKQIEQKVNTSQLKTDIFTQGEFLAEKSIRHYSDASTKLKQNNKILSNMDSSNNNSEHEVELKKFSLCQVDQLLSEMEKTRAEIRNKLQSNKNKIYEMKEEYASNTKIHDFGRNTPSFNTMNEVDQNFDTCVNANEMIKMNKKPSLRTEENMTYSGIFDDSKKQLTTNINIALSRDPKNILQVSNIVSKDNNIEVLQQKLEAEILKKKHCEEIIKKLQFNLLEVQENLSVAQKIDAEKEEIICQLKLAWVQLVEHWKELEQQRQELSLMLERERTESKSTMAKSNQKIEQLENRLHEAISLASGYQEKSEETGKVLKELQESTNELEDNLKKNEEYIQFMEIEKSNLLEQLHQTNENLTSEKHKCLSLESKIADFEDQISRITIEKNELFEKLQEEKKLKIILNSEIIKLKENYNQAHNAELIATKEANVIKQETLKIKNSLKEFYQKQLDIVLREKVEEYQKEVQKAQLLMHQEIRKQEKLLEEKSHLEITRLQESQKIELSEERRINQKHVNILKAELKESRKKISELENRLKEDSASKIELTKRIQRNHYVNDSEITFENKNIFKQEFLTSTNKKFLLDDEKDNEMDDEFADRDISRQQLHKMSVDLKKYISMLLTKEPGNPIDDCKNLEILSYNEFESEKNPNEAQKTTDNFRKKPPWK